MNYSHIHLILNHFPVIGLPLVTVFLIFAFLKNNQQMKKFSMVILFFIGLVALPVFFTGEPAEELIEDFPGVSEAVIHPHEEMGEKALIICLVAATLSLSALVLVKNEKLNHKLTLATIGVAILGSMALVYTANLGGQIRHTENRLPLFKPINR